MSAELGLAAARVAPLYNIALVVVVTYLFIRMFRAPVKNEQVYMFPWKLIFLALLVFIVEEILTILRQAQLITIPVHVNGFFELIIISIFIYTLLLQRQFVEKRYGAL